MITAGPDYKLLYEQSQKRLIETEQKLKLALLDANELRRNRIAEAIIRYKV